jgi:TolB-like protein/Tfp pilus assembly protein PilF
VHQPGFFAELKRRNVYKVAVAYAVVGWLIVQVATQVFPFLEIPNWIVRLVIVLVTIGFPIALVIAWAFELTPQGIKRTEDVDLARKHSRGGTWSYVAIIGALFSIGLFFVGRYSVRRSAPASELPAKSIAVLPFENLSGDPDNAYFAEGVQEEILTRLAKVADLKVISRTSTQRFKSSPNDLREIAKQLGIAHILEGSVQKSADQVRVNVQLINALTDAHLWAEIYDRKLTDIFAVESDIAKTIADSLQAKLSRAEQHAIADKPTNNPEAHELYLRGRFFWNKRTEPDLRTAIRYFEQAIEKDPNYARAYAGIADSYDVLFFYSIHPIAGKDAFPKAKAKATAQKALEIDESLAEAHNALAYPLLEYRWDFPAAEKEFRRAIELNPNYAPAHHWYSEYLGAMGRLAEAMTEIRRAKELDPLSLIINTMIGFRYYRARQYDEAIREGRATVAMDENFAPAHEFLGYVEEASGNYQEAIAQYETAALLYGRQTREVAAERGAALREAYRGGGARGYWAKKLEFAINEEQTGNVDPYAVAQCYGHLGERDKTLEWLERTFTARHEGLLHLNEEAVWDELRTDTRFRDLLRRLGLPQQ